MRRGEGSGEFWEVIECLLGRQRTGVDDLNGLGWRIFASCWQILLRAEDDFIPEGLGDVYILGHLKMR